MGILDMTGKGTGLCNEHFGRTEPCERCGRIDRDYTGPCLQVSGVSLHCSFALFTGQRVWFSCCTTFVLYSCIFLESKLVKLQSRHTGLIVQICASSMIAQNIGFSGTVGFAHGYCKVRL